MSTIFSPADQPIIRRAVDQFIKTTLPNKPIFIISQAELLELLSPEAEHCIGQVLRIDPYKHGFKGARVDTVEPPSTLTITPPQMFTTNGETKYTRPQALLPHVYDAYLSLTGAAQNDIGRPILIEAAYRSPAYQIMTFLRYLVVYDFDIEKTAKRVALPGYSEHGSVTNPAFDFQTIDGSPSDDNPQDFALTPEYRWLTANAKQYGFRLSYPQDNPDGIMFEPWHWRYIVAND